jgi:amidase
MTLSSLSLADTGQDDPELSSGAPLSIQVFTTKMRDEECLQVAAVVDECLRAV